MCDRRVIGTSKGAMADTQMMTGETTGLHDGELDAYGQVQDTQ